MCVTDSLDIQAPARSRLFQGELLEVFVLFSSLDDTQMLPVSMSLFEQLHFDCYLLPVDAEDDGELRPGTRCC